MRWIELLATIAVVSFCFESAQSKACMSRDVHCGVCCCWQTEREIYSASCADRGLTELPSLGWIEHSVTVLALQRNKFRELHSSSIVARFPNLLYIDISEQVGDSPVLIVGPALSSYIKIQGKFYFCPL